MNSDLAAFFVKHYAPGRVGLVGATDLVGRLVRAGQARLTVDRQPSRWSHTFILGERRDDGRTDGSLYIFESDLQVSVRDWRVLNGAMESRLVKWCRDDVECAAVVGMDLSTEERAGVLRKALEYAYDDRRLRYPVGELFGTLWASLTGKLSRKNVFDDEFAVQCSTFVRMCYQHVGRDPLGNDVDLTHTSPEALYRSAAFTFRGEWSR